MIIEGITFWHWLVLAVALTSLELLLPGSFLIWLGLAAAEVGILFRFIPSLSWEAQILTFSFLAVINVLLGRRYFASRKTDNDHPLLNQRLQQMIGREITLKEPIINGEGWIVMNDSRWKVAGPDLTSGSRIKIDAVEEGVLKVSTVHASNNDAD